jgi:hypothetical protein
MSGTFEQSSNRTVEGTASAVPQKSTTGKAASAAEVLSIPANSRQAHPTLSKTKQNKYTHTKVPIHPSPTAKIESEAKKAQPKQAGHFSLNHFHSIFYGQVFYFEDFAKQVHP